MGSKDMGLHGPLEAPSFPEIRLKPDFRGSVLETARRQVGFALLSGSVKWWSKLDSYRKLTQGAPVKQKRLSLSQLRTTLTLVHELEGEMKGRRALEAGHLRVSFLFAPRMFPMPDLPPHFLG
ncbi:hypothetical protein NBRC116590_31710 [Pelagimonas sp. KU-00592-HH]|uniref:hypothetical protein n=1 Tax=Pelagimonas sp. KU-00592-HH TaxID=3127651 RepID=UPI0031082FF2